MASTIELLSNSRQSLLVRLGRADVRISVWYQPTDAGWYISIESPVNTPLVSGRRIVSGAALVPQSLDFVGNIYCLPLTDDANEPQRNAWGNTHNLVFVDGD